MKKTLLLIVMLTLLVSCYPSFFKAINQEKFNIKQNEYKSKQIQNYSFNCIIGLYSSPCTYDLSIEINNGKLYKKRYNRINEEDTTTLSEDEINEKLDKIKSNMGDAYNNSIEQFCIEKLNSMEDVFLLISTLYARELELYNNDTYKNNFDSYIKYDDIYSYPKDFFCHTTNRFQVAMPSSVGINVKIENFSPIQSKLVL